MRRTGTKQLKESQSRRLPSGGTFSDSFFLRPESSVPTGRKTKAAWKKAFRLVRGSGASDDDDADGSQLLQALTLAADERGSGGAPAEAASPPARTSVATWTPSGGDTGQAQAVEGAASASKLRWKKAVAKTIVVVRAARQAAPSTLCQPCCVPTRSRQLGSATHLGHAHPSAGDPRPHGHSGPPHPPTPHPPCPSLRLASTCGTRMHMVPNLITPDTGVSHAMATKNTALTVHT